MRSPFYFIVTPVGGERYVTERNGLIVSVSEEDHKNSNREAIVIELPSNYNGPISIGDKLLVHHNVFKYYNDVKGARRSGKSFLRDGYFYLDETQFYMYNHDGKWVTVKDYCFVKPSLNKDFYLEKGTLYEPLVGVIKYSNSELEKLGVCSGDEICFEPNSEYEFFVDGEVLYRMRTKSIAVKI